MSKALSELFEENPIFEEINSDSFETSDKSDRHSIRQVMRSLLQELKKNVFTTVGDGSSDE